MTRMRRGKRRSVLAFAGVALAVAALLTLEFLTTPRTAREEWPAEFRSNGERLYFTGVSADGQPMRALGGNPHMLMMGGSACVVCHGVDREGGRLRPSYWTVAPAITAEALTGGHDEAEDHAHSPYTRESLAKAITSGVRPDGSRIGIGMPRWTMSPEDLASLVEFLLPDVPDPL